MPGILYTGAISVVMFTFVKILNENFKFFTNSLLILALGFITNCLAQVLFCTPEAISYASLITMAVWFVLEGNHLKKLLKLSYLKEFCYVLAITAGFLAITNLISQPVLGMGCYLAFFLVTTLVCYPGLPKEALSYLGKNNK